MATFVIIHGGWGGGWIFQAMARRLRVAGHEVYTPTLTGMGDRIHLAHPEIDLDAHVLDVVNMLYAEDLRDVLLVGYSYGGMVLTGVAERVPERLAHLIYLDAFVPHNGESLLDLLAPEARSVLEDSFRQSDDGWRDSHDLPRPWPNPIPPRLAPHPWKTFTQPLKVLSEAAAMPPRTYVRCTSDKGSGEFMGQSFALSYMRAQAAGWRILEVEGDHNSPKTEQSADWLLQLFDPLLSQN